MAGTVRINPAVSIIPTFLLLMLTVLKIECNALSPIVGMAGIVLADMAGQAIGFVRIVRRQG